MISRNNGASAPRLRFADVIGKFKEGEWGFTGTRAGMTPFQREITIRVFKSGAPLILRHGGAFGSDFEAHTIWSHHCKNRMAEIWPADVKRKQLFANQKNVYVQDIMLPLDRNIEIVKRSQFMVATPHTEAEEQRSGTWQTVRETLKANKPILIVWPFTKRLTFYEDKKLYRVTYTLVDS